MTPEQMRHAADTMTLSGDDTSAGRLLERAAIVEWLTKFDDPALSWTAECIAKGVHNDQE